ncbi:hypothetical protein GCM10011575_24420 [Microlunatus endophyticus]|uniref:DUF4097 domain-containing protein n=1 Tax=Microlunatus endophyticus TaxID=1716077 RepID=A0A917S903_9ACTN|nr:DUF4097 family beta strand repeat-containing protein [Microlunatus endophyticus]GGL65205.1 hypothetical protein GCM10011575_24420 [Microlunatus endophyticus]
MSTRNFVYTGIIGIIVRNLGSGEIRLHESSDGGVSGAVTSHNEDFLDRIGLSEDGGRLVISFPRSFNDADADLHLSVPDGIDFEATTGSAEVSAEVGLSATKITTGSGDVSLDSVNDVQVTTGSGDVSIQTINGTAGQVTSGSGDISIGGAASALQAKSASGDVSIGELTGALRVNTASGDVNVGRTVGSVEGRSASGDINIAVGDDLPTWLELSSVSGEVLIGLDATDRPAEGDPFVSIRATTASGDISISRA